MLNHLEIENFKSIKHIELDCKRINIFIGEPNTGKSNILESLGIFSLPYGHISDFVRFERMSNLFYDENVEDAIRIKADEKILEIIFEGTFNVTCRDGEKVIFQKGYDHSGTEKYLGGNEPIPFKFYKFMVRSNFPRENPGSLLPPSGGNLLAVLMTSRRLKSLISQIFAPFGLKLVFKPQEGKIEVLKQLGDIFVTYPYSLISETLQRIVFYITAIESNKDSLLIFEEPESHAFPFYTKYLAEIIALDKSNQYFISTHNPYFLLSVLEKSPKNEIEIFATYFKNYQTKVVTLDEKELTEVLDMGIDLFFNIERFLEGKE